jgi:cobalt-zinc-cadmium resistance protein CzcA
MVQVPGVAEINTWGGYEKQSTSSSTRSGSSSTTSPSTTSPRVLQRGNRNAGGGVLDQAGESQLIQGQGWREHRRPRSDGARERGRAPPSTARRRRGAGGPRDPARRRHRGGRGRGRARARLHAHGREQPRADASGSRSGSNGGAARASPRRRGDPVYSRTDLVVARCSRRCATTSSRARCSSSRCSSSSSATCARADRRAAIPLSMLFAFNAMLQFGIAGSLMSLGAIDFGLVVDSSVIMVENAARRWTRTDGPQHPRDRARRRGRGPKADALRRAHHRHRLPADPRARGRRGEAVPPDGAHGDLRAGRLDGPVDDAHAGARELRAEEGPRQATIAWCAG